jgi:predicted nucleotidyltransferase
LELKVVNRINAELSRKFNDYSGVYFFGSRLNGTHTDSSDYDVAIVFGSLDHEKKLDIAGVIARIEYEESCNVDYKLLTQSGNRSIDFIRKNVNPVFIQHAIDKGYYIGRV